MARFSALLALCTWALVASVAASPIVVRDSLVTLPLARHFNATAARNIVAYDKARIQALRSRSQGSKHGPAGIPVRDAFDVYTVDVEVGTPPTTYTLIVDTGSSNTWVGAGAPYQATSSSVDTGEEVVNRSRSILSWCYANWLCTRGFQAVFYGSGFFEGEEFLDTVSVGPFTIHNQSIGVAEEAFGFEGFDGILG